MSVEQNKSIIRRWIDFGWNGHNVNLIDEIYHSNVVQYDNTSPEGTRGTEALKQFVGVYIGGIPDLKFSIDLLIGEGDDVVWRFTAKGAQTAPLMGIPPTGRSVTVTGIAVFRFAGSKVSTVWVNFDALGMLQQLGVIPAMSA